MSANPARARLAIRVSSPDAARQALSLGADYVLAPVRRERPVFTPDRLSERGDEPELFLAIAADESLPAEPARVARLREIGEVDALGDFSAVLLDPERALLRAFRSEELRVFAERCRAAGLECWFGGALEAPDVPRLLVLGPDALVFEEGVPLEPLRDLLRAPELAEEGPTDLVLVRDFVVPLGIGAYAFERARPQRVRFGVEAEVTRPHRRPREMGDVYSYDLILDAVRRLTERGHTALVETLAEDLAAEILGDARVRRVRVEVEKLDLGPGAVGIRIERTRDDLLIG